MLILWAKLFLKIKSLHQFCIKKAVARISQTAALIPFVAAAVNKTLNLTPSSKKSIPPSSVSMEILL